MVRVIFAAHANDDLDYTQTSQNVRDTVWTAPYISPTLILFEFLHVGSFSMVCSRFLQSIRPFLLSLTGLLLVAASLYSFAPNSAFAQTDSATEKHAFDAAKELGTADAWNAFLANYTSGFYADMARAYLKKINEPSLPAPDANTAQPQLPPSSERAGELSCSERDQLRSRKATEPTKITFVNKSGMYRAFMWIDFDGKLKDYGGVNSGDQITFDTYRTHPWMVATGPGDCLQIFTAAAGHAVVELQRLAADDPPQAKRSKVRDVQNYDNDDEESDKVRDRARDRENDRARERERERERARDRERSREREKSKSKPIVCGENYKLRKGKCVLIQNCGKNAYRSAEGDCYCKKGYNMQNGVCTWPQDKKGFEVAPWKKGGCKGLQAQCSSGNGGACQKYEEQCQVN